MKAMSRWISTEQAALDAGMTTEWVRHQITSGRLEAIVFETGRRRTYRISRAAWRQFLGRYSRAARGPSSARGGDEIP